MKKWMLMIVALFVSVSAFSQSCLDDVWQCLTNKQVPKAKKFMESCMASNPDNAAVWLMQANVNVHLYTYDIERMKNDPSLSPRYPNALEDAYLAFQKAMELDPKVEPKSGMLGPKEGQQLLADAFNTKAATAQEKQKFDEALKYYGYAAKCYELGKKKENAAVVYYYTALVYSDMKDMANFEKMMLKALDANPKISSAAYVVIYDIYKDRNDTVKCAEILAKAEKNFPDDKTIYETQMDYYAMTGNMDKLMEICDKAIATGDVKLIPTCATYLSNAKAYEKAEQLLRGALANDPNNFNLLKQMGYRYALEYYDLMDQRKKAMDSRQWDEANRIYQGPERKAAMENAHEWCDKAYKVNSDDLDNNRILREMKVLLGLPADPELNAKIQARQQN
jgi:tetratricopeptide (TPR) repeat protein